MENRLNRKMLLLAALAVIAGICGEVYFMKQSDEKREMSLRVAFPYDKPVSFYEPTNIHLAPEYFFLEYIYSPLVEVGKEGELTIAETFTWQGDDLHLKIRDDLRTVSGKKITIDDVVFSLKRLLVKTGNTHGNFSALVCGGTPLTNVEAECPGIVQEGSTVILKAGKRKTFLLPMLAAIDFAIIPRSSVDPVSLAITNYTETSGPYFVSSDDGEGHIVLKANPNHFHYSAKMPQTVYLVPTDPKSPTASIDALKAGTVDFITTIDAARPEYVIDASREISNTKLHTTMNIRSIVLAFSSRGLKELSQNERILIGRKIKEAFLKGFAGASGYQESFQFFPSFADGGLSKPEVQTLKDRDAHAEGEIPKKLKLVVVRLGEREKFAKMFEDAIPGIEVEVGGPPEFGKFEDPNDMPHMSLTGPDTGFLEDIGLISYSLSSGLFGMTKPEREKWLSEYMLIPTKEERLHRLHALHLQVLTEPVIVPLMVAPYVALIRGKWALEFPQYYGNSPLWLIKAI